MKSHLPQRPELFQYGFIALPLAFAGLPLYIHAPDYYIRELGIGMGTLGLVLLCIRIFDALQDPIIGYLSDRYHSSRSRIIFIGVLLLTLGMAGIFYGPQFNINVTIWFIIAMIIATTGFSITSINLNQIGGFWRDEPEQRTRIAAWREAFALVGLLLSALLPTLLQHYFDVSLAFALLFWIFALLLVTSFFLFNQFISNHSLDNDIPNNHSQHFHFLSLFLGKNRTFFLVCFLAQLASSLPAVLVLIFIRDYLNIDDLVGVFLFLYFLSGALFITVWVKLSQKLGKLNTWLLSMCLSVIVFIWVYTLSPGDAFAYGVICILSGIVLGADLALPPSILADRITVQQDKAIATQYYAALGFIPKVAVSIASGVAFLVLDKLGFVVDAENNEHALAGLIMLYGLLPCLIKIIAAGLLFYLQKHEGKDYEYFEKHYTNGVVNVS